jgi:L,D-transpeptidase YcbB
VGRPPMETPELAGLIRFAIVNPYWNLPPDVVRQSVAPRVQREGPGYLARHRYVLFSDWRDTAVPLEHDQVDWGMVAAGLQKVWVRQLPGGDNMMGDVKFMLPNRLGIYLHDTPRKRDFARSDRRLSSGCVRVEDAPGLARWLFGHDVLERGEGTPEKRIDLPQPVPVYITYLTAVPEGGRLRFQQDVYDRDEALIPAVNNLS